MARNRGGPCRIRALVDRRAARLEGAVRLRRPPRTSAWAETKSSAVRFVKDVVGVAYGGRTVYLGGLMRRSGVPRGLRAPAQGARFSTSPWPRRAGGDWAKAALLAARSRLP